MFDDAGADGDRQNRVYVPRLTVPGLYGLEDAR